MTTSASRPVTVLSTGGTIASRPEGNAVSVRDGGSDLVRRVADRLGVRVDVRDIMLTHSFNLRLADVLTIARAARREVEAGRGVVVTHGTDTMEETAYFVDLVLPGNSCVVFTGAQRHAGDPDGDGPGNLVDAITVAADPAVTSLGACVVMAGTIHHAQVVTKAHTRALDGFVSSGRHPVGAIADGRATIRELPSRPRGFDLAELGDLPARVDIVPVYLDADGVQLAACRAAGARGIVLQALGIGNPTPGVLEEVRACVAAGMVVLVTSRCPGGDVAPVYGAGGGADLAAAGALFAGSLPAPKARLLLAAAVSSEQEPRRAIARMAPFITASTSGSGSGTG